MLEQVETETRIRQMLADTDKSYAKVRLLIADQAKRQQDIKLAPFTVIAAALGAAAALFAAGAGFMTALLK